MMAMDTRKFQHLTERRGPRTIISLDVEAKPDPFAKRICGRGGAAPSIRLWELTCASLATIKVTDNWELEEARLDILTTEDTDELDLLENLEAQISRVAPEALVLLTYDGARHDLPLIRARQVRWWLGGRTELQSAAEQRHLDVGLWCAGRRGRVPALRDSCASIGVAIQPLVRIGPTDEKREHVKCELDALGTLILGVYALSDISQTVDPLKGILPGLGAWFEEWTRGRPHLEGLALNPSFRNPPGPWGLKRH